MKEVKGTRFMRWIGWCSVCNKTYSRRVDMEEERDTWDTCGGENCKRIGPVKKRKQLEKMAEKWNQEKRREAIKQNK